MHCEKTNISSMKFQSDILMNILFILDTNFIKSDTDFSLGKTFQLRHYVGAKRRPYGVKGMASIGVIMEERVKYDHDDPIDTSHFTLLYNITES